MVEHVGSTLPLISSIFVDVDYEGNDLNPIDEHPSPNTHDDCDPPTPGFFTTRLRTYYYYDDI